MLFSAYPIHGPPVSKVNRCVDVAQVFSFHCNTVCSMNSFACLDDCFRSLSCITLWPSVKIKVKRWCIMDHSSFLQKSRMMVVLPRMDLRWMFYPKGVSVHTCRRHYELDEATVKHTHRQNSQINRRASIRK